jgi:hypothetical protein
MMATRLLAMTLPYRVGDLVSLSPEAVYLSAFGVKWMDGS